MRIIVDSPIQTEDRLVFQRMLGFKEEMPGSGMWYESSKLITYKPHYKSDCWICDRHVYSLIFWSKGMAYKLDPIFDK